jgi:hypothetical protein
MDHSRISSRLWASRHWSCNSRGSSRYGRGNGISRRIQSLATASVRPHNDTSLALSAELNHLQGVPLHPLHKTICLALDDFVLDNSSLKGCAPFILAHPYMIPSTSYATKPPSPVLPFHVRSRLRILSPPPPASSGEPSPTFPKQGTDIFASSMNATRGAMGATGQAFVAIGASMDVRKWSWPGYLTFNKGTLQKIGPQDHQLAGAENGSEKQQVEPAEDNAAGEPVSPNTEARIEVEVDRESLHEAMSDGIGEPPGEETVGEEIAAVTEVASEITDTTTPETDATLQGTCEPLQDEQKSSPPASPSTPVVHPPDFVSPPSPTSSQGTLPVPTPAPSFRSFTFHFAHDDPLATVQRRVLFITVSVFPTCHCD